MDRELPVVSIIIPVFHERERIGWLLEHLSQVTSCDPVEVIVVDGSWDQDTIGLIATRPDVITMASDRGRARQMNAGASVARGDILLFLHADTELPPNGLRAIHSVMREGRCVGGAFELAINSPKRIFRILARWASLRSRITRIPYGDQAIFVRRDYFESIGGYADIPIMEDVELMRRIKKRGDRICILPQRALTSARRWEKEGFAYVNIRNTLLVLLYVLGVSPQKLAAFYRTHQGKRLDG